jgi:hypothetical protein
MSSTGGETMHRTSTVLRAALAAALLAATPALGAVPHLLTYSGYLKSSAGAPVVSTTSITFALYTTATGTTPVWGPETINGIIPSADGWFSVILGASPQAALPTVLGTDDLFLGIKVLPDTAELTPRAQLTSAPSALAVNWTNVVGRPGLCTAPAVLQGFDAAGLPVCAAGGGGGVTSVAKPGGSISPLTVTGTTSVTIELPKATSVSDGYLSGADWAAFNSKISSPTTCANGQVLTYNAGAWSCSAVSVAPGAVLPSSLPGTSGTGQVPSKAAGDAWTWVSPSLAGHTHAGGEVTSAVATASALALIPASCTPGQAASGIGANGNAAGCFTPPGTYALPDATAAVKGGLQLAGDLGGTAAAPIIALGRVLPTKLGASTTANDGMVPVKTVGVDSWTWATPITTANIGTQSVSNSLSLGGNLAGSYQLSATAITTSNIGVQTVALANGVSPGSITPSDLNSGAATALTGQVAAKAATTDTWTWVTPSTGTVTSVTPAAGSPITVATGTTTPVIGIAAASTSTSGALSAADWNTFNGKQAPLAASCPAGQSLSGISAGGTITCTAGNILATAQLASGAAPAVTVGGTAGWTWIDGPAAFNIPAGSRVEVKATASVYALSTTEGVPCGVGQCAGTEGNLVACYRPNVVTAATAIGRSSSSSSRRR